MILVAQNEASLIQGNPILFLEKKNIIIGVSLFPHHRISYFIVIYLILMLIGLKPKLREAI